MDDPLMLLFHGIHSMVAGYGAVYMASALLAPNWFLANLSVNNAGRRFNERLRARSIMPSGKGPWYAMPLALLTLVAVGVLVYAAAYAIFIIVPADVGGVDEDGEWTSLRSYLQGMIGFVGGISLPPALEKAAVALTATGKAEQC